MNKNTGGQGERQIIIKDDGFAYDLNDTNKRVGHVANWQKSWNGQPFAPAVGLLSSDLKSGQGVDTASNPASGR